MNAKKQTDVFAVIDLAIRKKQVIQIKYHNIWRTIEPYQLGRHKLTKELVLYSYCRDVVPTDFRQSRWQVFNLDDIRAIELTNYSFQVHIDYKGDYSFIETVFVKLKPLWERITAGYIPIRMTRYTAKRNRYTK